MLRASCNAVLIVAACVAAGGKLRHGTPNVVDTTQEVNRCLSVVRAAAGSRKLVEPVRKATRHTDPKHAHR